MSEEVGIYVYTPSKVNQGMKLILAVQLKEGDPYIGQKLYRRCWGQMTTLVTMVKATIHNLEEINSTPKTDKWLTSAG